MSIFFCSNSNTVANNQASVLTLIAEAIWPMRNEKKVFITNGSNEDSFRNFPKNL